jgi:hypothetical protein
MQEMFSPERLAADMIDFYKSATLNSLEEALSQIFHLFLTLGGM